MVMDGYYLLCMDIDCYLRLWMVIIGYVLLLMVIDCYL